MNFAGVTRFADPRAAAGSSTLHLPLEHALKTTTLAGAAPVPHAGQSARFFGSRKLWKLPRAALKWSICSRTFNPGASCFSFTITLTASIACKQPMSPGTAPSTPESAQVGAFALAFGYG
eukprot:scaffold1437_cov268-Pinguiococcus_pyrenoidosus.AAC.7